MPNAVTASDMWDRGLDLADMTGTDFPDTTFRLPYLNEGLSELYELLVQSHEDYMTKESSAISIVSGTESYALPTDFHKLAQVFLTRNNRRYLMDPFELTDMDGYRTSPVSDGTAVLFYIPELTLFTSTSDTVADVLPGCPVGWERLIVLHVAMQLALREESFQVMQMLQMQKEREVARIESIAEQRTYEGNAVGDHYSRWDYAGLEADRIQGQYRYRIIGENIHFIQVEPWGL